MPCGARVKPPNSFAEVGDHVEDAVGDGDEEDADDGEAEREQPQAEDDESLGSRSLHRRRHSNWLGSQVAAIALTAT